MRQRYIQTEYSAKVIFVAFKSCSWQETIVTSGPGSVRHLDSRQANRKPGDTIVLAALSSLVDHFYSN